MQRENYLSLLTQYVKNPNMIKHCLASEAVLLALAEKFNEDKNKWALAGLLHDIDVEITCNALKRKILILEVPVFYNPRTFMAGKKIRWYDGLWALFYMFKYRFSD